MRIGKSILRRAVVWLILGLIGGGIAADLWWRQATRGTDKQVKQLQTEIDSEKMGAQQLESKLAEAGGELRQLKEQLAAERNLRRRYEDLVTRGRK